MKGMREKKIFSCGGYQWGEESHRKREGGCIWWICFVSIYENRRMKFVEIVLRREGGGNRENDGVGKSN
jgi:hypothetical protein